MSRTVVIHQPEYFPWLGFLDKARQADVLVLLDSVQFDRSSLQHRAKIVGANGPLWLTMPYVHRFPQRIDEVELAADRWSVKHQKSVQACYGRAPAYKQVAPQLERVFSSVHKRLVDVTVPSCELLLDAFGVRPKELLRSSALDVKGDKGDLVIEIVKKLEGTRYLSGRTGATYLDGAALAAAGIELAVQSFELRAYATRTLADLPRGVSALDAWMLLGDDAPRYFSHGG
jgi:hypothetical protein